MGAFITTLLAKKAAGHLVGMVLSKTMVGATGLAGGAIWQEIPGALAGDAEAVGKITLYVLGWLFTLYGRVKASLS